MDFLKKAKQKAQEFGQEHGIDLNLDKINLGDGPTNNQSAPPSQAPSEAPSQSTYAPSSSTGGSFILTPGTTTANTSVPPSSASGAPKKLPMTVRKSIRDDFENKIPELEAEMEKHMKTKWTVFVDTANVFSYSSETEAAWARENPGSMYYSYFSRGGISHIGWFLDKFSDDGRDQLNKLAYTHTFTFEPADDPKPKYSSCDIKDGKLRMVFNPSTLGINSDAACEDLAGAVHNAAAESEAGAGAGGGAALSLAARNSIRTSWEKEGPQYEATLRKWLKEPTLTFAPNFEENFAKLKAYQQSDPDEPPLRKEWESQIGEATLSYFSGLVHRMEDKGFKKDGMLQDGFKDSVEKSEVVLKVVDSLPGNKRNDTIIEGGVLVIRTTRDNWWVNSTSAAENIVDLL